MAASAMANARRDSARGGVLGVCVRCGRLAEPCRVGVSRQWVSGVERGKPRAEVGLILRALRALGLDLSVGPQDEGARPRHEPELPNIDIDAVVEKARGGDR